MTSCTLVRDSRGQQASKQGGMRRGRTGERRVTRQQAVYKVASRLALSLPLFFFNLPLRPLFLQHLLCVFTDSQIWWMTQSPSRAVPSRPWQVLLPHLLRRRLPLPRVRPHQALAGRRLPHLLKQPMLSKCLYWLPLTLRLQVLRRSTPPSQEPPQLTRRGHAMHAPRPSMCLPCSFQGQRPPSLTRAMLHRSARAIHPQAGALRAALHFHRVL